MIEIQQHGNLNSELVAWNNEMYQKHPTPYEKGMAKIIEDARARMVIDFAAVTTACSVLELGCESGKLLARLPEAKRVVGADISRTALLDACRLFAERNLNAEFHQLDASQPLPFSPGEFDVVICSEMLEHVRDPRQVLENIARIAAPETRLVISIPIEAPKVAIKKVLRAVGLLKWLFPGIEVGQSEWHLQSFSKAMLLDLSSDLFERIRGTTVWGSHYVGEFRRKAAESITGCRHD